MLKIMAGLWLKVPAVMNQLRLIKGDIDKTSQSFARKSFEALQSEVISSLLWKNFDDGSDPILASTRIQKAAEDLQR